jgi:hypothetical protein
MADTKISALPASTSPLSSTDVLPIVQGGATKKTSVASLNSWFPAFSVYLTSSQTPASSTLTKITLNAETFDTASAFDSVTNYRFQPTVAGYYQINASSNIGGGADLTAAFISLYKNGAEYKRGQQLNIFGVPIANVTGSCVSDIVYLNGSTDFLELYGYITSSTPIFSGGISQTWMSGSLIRSA